MKFATLFLSSLFLINAFAIETKRELKIEAPLHTGFFGVSVGAMNDYEFLNDISGTKSDGRFDRSYEVFGQSYVYTSTNKYAKGAVSMGLGLLYLSEDIYDANIEDKSFDIYNLSGDLAFHYIPNHVFRFFIGLKSNYAMVPNKEFTAKVNGVEVKEIIEYTGGISFGFQTGFDIVVGPSFMQLRYQSFNMPLEVSAKTLSNNVETSSSKVKGTYKISQVVVSVGVNF